MSIFNFGRRRREAAARRQREQDAAYDRQALRDELDRLRRLTEKERLAANARVNASKARRTDANVANNLNRREREAEDRRRRDLEDQQSMYLHGTTVNGLYGYPDSFDRDGSPTYEPPAPQVEQHRSTFDHTPAHHDPTPSYDPPSHSTPSHDYGGGGGGYSSDSGSSFSGGSDGGSF